METESEAPTQPRRQLSPSLFLHMSLIPEKTIVSLLGVGYLRPASGTIGSFASGILLYWLWPDLLLWQKGLITLIVFLLGCWCADRIEKKEKLHDPHFVVIDEAVGMMITTAFIAQVWWHWLIAFFLFRFFDIAKLWPASVYDKKPGGFAIMFDDVIMALPALGILHFFITFI